METSLTEILEDACAGHPRGMDAEVASAVRNAFGEGRVKPGESLVPAEETHVPLPELAEPPSLPEEIFAIMDETGNDAAETGSVRW